MMASTSRTTKRRMKRGDEEMTAADHADEIMT
jgi:hypothetical protein